MRNKRLAPSPDHFEEGINLTPLIDVVFVVLIMFILIAPMLELDRIKLAEGSPKEKANINQEHLLVIHVYEDNTIRINQRSIQLENLKSILHALYEKNPHLTPQLFHDKRAMFGTYQMVKTALEEAGFEQLDLILDPK